MLRGQTLSASKTGDARTHATVFQLRHEVQLALEGGAFAPEAQSRHVQQVLYARR